MAQKPLIIVTSKDSDDTFGWQSGGWNSMDIRDTPEAKRLFKKAKTAIGKAKDVADAVRLLKEAGFEIERAS